MGSQVSKLEATTKRISNDYQNNKNYYYPTLLNIPKVLCDAPAVPPPPPLEPLAAPPLPDGTGSSSSSDKSDSNSSSGGSGSDSIADAAALASAYKNPGPFEIAQREARGIVSIDTFDGFRCDINKQLSPFMAVVHSFWLGTTCLPDGRKKSYSFVTQVASEDGGMLVARLDPEDGSMNGQIHRVLFGGLAMFKTVMSVSAPNSPSGGQNDQMLTELDFGAQTWTSNFKYGSMGGGHVLAMSYFQTITPRLAMGGEGMYLAANGAQISNYFLRYQMPAKTGEEDATIIPSKDVSKTNSPTSNPEVQKLLNDGADIENGGSSTFYAGFNTAQQSLGLSYKRVVTPKRVTLGADLQISPDLSSQLQLGAEFKLSRSRVHFGIDGSGKIQSVVDTKLGMQPGSPSINFSGEIDHLNDDMKFGFGINFEG